MSIRRNHGSSGMLIVLPLLLALVACADQEKLTGPEQIAVFLPEDKVECQTSEIPIQGEPTCTLDGITVYAPPGNEPRGWDPPPNPPEPGLPDFTPPDGGFGETWRTPSDDTGRPPEIEGAYADGPAVFLACMLAALSMEELQYLQDVEDAMDVWRASMKPLHEAQVAFSFALEAAHKGDIGDLELAPYGEARDDAQLVYNLRKEDLLFELRKSHGVTWAEAGAAAAGCALAAWIPSW